MATKKKAAKKSAPKKKAAADRRKMNASEAIVNFVGKLTTRKEPLIFSAAHNCTPINDIASAFIQANKLPELREDFPISKPLSADTDRLTNVPATAIRSMTPEETFRAIIGQIRSHGTPQQNEIVANLLFELQKDRDTAVNSVETEMALLKNKAFDVNHEAQGFEAIRKGGFEKLAFQKYTGVK